MPQSGSEATSKKFKNRGFAFVKFSSHAVSHFFFYKNINHFILLTLLYSFYISTLFKKKISQTAARAFRAGSKPDFVLGGTLHPSVQWVEEDPEVDPDELAKVFIDHHNNLKFMIILNYLLLNDFFYFQIKIAFVRKLPSTIDEDYLKKLFMPFGKVEKVVVSSKGDSSVGFVHFSQRSVSRV